MQREIEDLGRTPATAASDSISALAAFSFPVLSGASGDAAPIANLASFRQLPISHPVTDLALTPSSVAASSGAVHETPGTASAALSVASRTPATASPHSAMGTPASALYPELPLAGHGVEEDGAAARIVTSAVEAGVAELSTMAGDGTAVLREVSRHRGLLPLRGAPRVLLCKGLAWKPAPPLPATAL